MSREKKKPVNPKDERFFQSSKINQRIPIKSFGKEASKSTEIENEKYPLLGVI